MKIAISGISGLVGSYLKQHFLKNGHQISEISRRRGTSCIFYDLKKKQIDRDALEGQDVIIHLAGANISAQKWTPAYKREILDSRIESTRLLVEAIPKLNKRPKIFLCASAIGYYGPSDGDLIVTERFSSGSGFLAEVCHEWENVSADLLFYGVRVIHLRFGVILSKKDGALAKMLPIFYFGLGGVLGKGTQKMSWIALDEIPKIIDFILEHDNINGPVNVVSPNPVTNREFTKTLGSVIHRPTVLPAPGFAIKALLGQMGQELLLEGAHVVPQVLLDAGYSFKYPQLREALTKII